MVLILTWYMLVIIHLTNSLLCYNGTFTFLRYGEDPLVHRGLFGPNQITEARMKCSLTTKCHTCSENAMCFVRSWSARARHSWIVQRGCYQPTRDDNLPRSMTIPTRAMTCKQERLPEAEYKVCLCQADWCNTTPSVVPCQSFMRWITYIITSIIIC